MAESDTAWEDFPSYYDVWLAIRGFLEIEYRDTFIQKRKLQSFEFQLSYYNFTLNDIYLVVFLSVAFTILRLCFTKWLFKPIAHRYKLTPVNAHKMPESAWKFLVQLCLWIYILYVTVLNGRYKFFQQPSTAFEKWDLTKSPPWDIHILLTVIFGYYLHSLYATAFLDTWRTESSVLLVHHVLTLVLISISYSLRYHNIACIVLLINEFTDVLLELAKLNIYFRVQDNVYKKIHAHLADVSFFIFVLAFFTTRLYLFPVCVLYHTAWATRRFGLFLPGILISNVLLWILQLINIYWSAIILQMLYNIATGKMEELDDPRDNDVDERVRKSYLKGKADDKFAQKEDAKHVDDLIVANKIVSAKSIRSRVRKEN